MNRRDALLATGGLLAGVVGCQNRYTPSRNVVVEIKEIREEEAKKKAKCPCIDPDDNPTYPLDRNHLHICAFHIGKDAPHSPQFEVTHYCTPVSEGLFQCILYDSPKPGAKLVGVEYVVVKDIYDSFSDEEKELWHPHDYEIKNGLLTIHGVPVSCEEKLLKALVGTYGKTWHTWPDFNTDVPLGKPMLMWSATGDNQVNQDLINKKDSTYKLNTKEIKKSRIELLGK